MSKHVDKAPEASSAKDEATKPLPVAMVRSRLAQRQRKGEA